MVGPLRLLDLRNLEQLFLSGRPIPPLTKEHKERMLKSLAGVKVTHKFEHHRVKLMEKVINAAKTID